MAKFYLSRDEWWPVAYLSIKQHFEGNSVEFSDEEISDLKRVEKEFIAWQVKILERFGFDHTMLFNGTLIEDGTD